MSLDLTLNKSSLNSIILTPLQKKREYSIKFVIMRSLDHIKQKFYKKKIKSKKLSLHKQSKFIKYEEICFYDYYFQEIAQKMNIPIESFYGFKNHTHRHNKYIPKSITKRVLSLWKRNPKFIGEIIEYMDNGFISNFKVFNKDKIHKMVGGWEKMICQVGIEAGVKVIIKSFNSKGCKLPWTLSEVKNALLVTKRILI